MTSSNHDHWNQLYRDKQSNEMSWFEEAPSLSLQKILSNSTNKSSVIDIGAGASFLVDQLIDLGYNNVTILDTAVSVLEQVQSRLNKSHSHVEFIAADITRWEPQRKYDLWHDRAVFHFMTTEESRRSYLSALNAAVTERGHVVLATFSEDGPEQCSGLTVQRYSLDLMLATIGEEFKFLSFEREVHITPWGAEQPFNWFVFQRVDDY